MAQFGVGIAQNYALVAIEEATECFEVLADHWAGRLQGWSRFVAELGTEIGDVVICCHALCGFEGFDLAEAIDDMTIGEMPYAGLGPAGIADRMVIEAGKLARAVIKRDQGVRGSSDQWSTEVRLRVALLAHAAVCLAPWFGLSAADAVTTRWADVSTRDARGHRPPSPGGHEQRVGRWLRGEAGSTELAAEEAAEPRERDGDGEPDGETTALVEREAAAFPGPSALTNVLCPAARVSQGSPGAVTVCRAVLPGDDVADCPRAAEHVSADDTRSQVVQWLQGRVDEQTAAGASPEQAMERVARGQAAQVPRCSRQFCTNRVPRPGSDVPGAEHEVCAACRADAVRCGDAVLVNTAAEINHAMSSWSGVVILLGPAAAVASSPALESGDVLVALHPRTWPDGSVRRLPGDGLVRVSRAMRRMMLRVDDDARGSMVEPAQVARWGPRAGDGESAGG